MPEERASRKSHQEWMGETHRNLTTHQAVTRIYSDPSYPFGFFFAINTISKISDSQNIENENINNLSLEDKLKSLKNFFDQKLISKEDYDKKKKEILDSF